MLHHGCDKAVPWLQQLPLTMKIGTNPAVSQAEAGLRQKHSLSAGKGVVGGIYPCRVEHPFGNVGCECDGWMDMPVISLCFAVIPRQRTSWTGTQKPNANHMQTIDSH